MSSSGKGQSKISTPADEQSLGLRHGRRPREPSRVIVEGFIDFDYEITQLTVRAAGRGEQAGQIVTQFCEPIGHIQVDGDYVESWQPHRMSPQALTRAREIASGHRQPGGQGIFGVELFVKGTKRGSAKSAPAPRHRSGHLGHPTPERI